jgi:hypothetical protein
VLKEMKRKRAESQSERKTGKGEGSVDVVAGSAADNGHGGVESVFDGRRG